MSLECNYTGGMKILSLFTIRQLISFELGFSGFMHQMIFKNTKLLYGAATAFCTRFVCFVLLFLVSPGVLSQPNSVTTRDYRFSVVEAIELEKIGIQFSIAEDRHGFSWFGGSSGLARFDGYEVKLFKNSEEDPLSLSYNEVTALLNDSRGQLWVGTLRGLNRYDESTGGFIRYLEDAENEYAVSSSRVLKLTEDLQGNIWVGTHEGGLVKINGQTGLEETVSLSADVRFDIQTASIRAMHTSESGLIWLGVHEQGLVVLDPNSNNIYYPPDPYHVIKTLAINSVKEGPNGNIWLATSDSGLLRYSPKSGEYKHYKPEPFNDSSLHHNTVWDIFFDDNNTMWVAADDALEIYRPEIDGFRHFTRLPGTDLYGKVRTLYQTRSGHLWLGMFPSGTAYLNIDATVFRNFQSIPFNNRTPGHNAVTSIVEDKKGNFWIGTEGGLDYFDTQTGLFTHYQHKDGDPSSLPSDSVLALEIDQMGDLWVGMWKGGWARFDSENQVFIPAKVEGGGSDHMKDEVWSIFEDTQGRLWLGGLYLYDRPSDTFRHYSYVYPSGDPLSSERVRIIHEDSRGNFWVGTIRGLDLFDRETGEIRHFQSPADNLSDNVILSLLEQGPELWVGTQAGGINKFNYFDQTFTSVRASDGLFDDSITGMVDGKKEHVWLLSGSGLIRYSKKDKTYKLFDYQNGLVGDLFHRNAILLSSKNELIVGGANGLTMFNPDEIKGNDFVPPVLLTGLDVLNQRVQTKTHPKILDRPIEVASEIHLNHSHNVFTLHYAAINYRLPGQNMYAYKLEGFDEDWNQVGNIRRATYTNLDPGTYVFRVKGSNNSGVWNEDGATLNIIISPPWWKTNFAYSLYAVLFIAFAVLFYYFLATLRKAKNERLINAQLRQVDEMKDAFLANTSHELRTPLNGIIGLTESLISQFDKTSREEALSKLAVVVGSSKRLSNIINDILDFSKLRNHEIVLKKEPVNLYDLVHTTVLLSEPLLDKKSLVLRNLVPKDFPIFLADEQRLSQILFNLLGNAIKFTEKGEVSVSARICDGNVELVISDTGMGISAEDCERIFLPFEQVLASANSKALGTGLGLAVTKKLVELHGGNISVNSRVGQGAVFTIQFPFNRSSEAAKTIDVGDFSANTQYLSGINYAKPSNTLAFKSQQADMTAPKILIVDDEPVNRMVLEGYLSLGDYLSSEAASGAEALKLINENRYDMILLDVMMPGLSGYQVCRELRKTFKLLELPIIFLTAKSQLEDLEEGYCAGGNDFIFKPVLKEELLAKVAMHLRASLEFCKNS